MDYVQPNFRESSNRAHWFLFGGNGAVVKMILKGRSSTCVIFRGCISCELCDCFVRTSFTDRRHFNERIFHARQVECADVSGWLFVRRREDAIRLLTMLQSSQARRQSQSLLATVFLRWLHCNMMRESSPLSTAHEKAQSDVEGQENPSQASDVQLQFQAPHRPKPRESRHASG